MSSLGAYPTYVAIIYHVIYSLNYSNHQLNHPTGTLSTVNPITKYQGIIVPLHRYLGELCTVHTWNLLWLRIKLWLNDKYQGLLCPTPILVMTL